MVRPVAKIQPQVEVEEEDVDFEDPIDQILSQPEELDEETEEDEDESDKDQSEDEVTGQVAVEDLPPDEQLWPDGPTAGQIVGWKHQYGDVYVTSVTLDKHIVWRTIARHEYRLVGKQVEQLQASGKLTSVEINMFNEEVVAEMCILFPQYSRASFAPEMAGIPSLVYQQILEASGFTSIDVRQL